MTKENMPVFVKIDEYKDVLDIMKVLKDKVEQATKIVNHLNKLKEEEEAELEIWVNNLEDIKKKMSFIDELLDEPKF